MNQEYQIATFAAGCFWGVEYTFSRVNGVISTQVGYTGGHVPNPNYEMVCQGNTGHAEAVQIKFDPAIISYNDLLKLFWQCHNPTQLNRQGPDVGHQYRSVIFYHDEMQKITAERSKKELESSKKYENSIVTEITPASDFYPAEEYHQQYIQKNGGGHCNV